MVETFGDRLAHAWNAFVKSDNESEFRRPIDYGVGGSYRQDRFRLNLANERSTLASIFTRISIDVAALTVRHVRRDQNDRYTETIASGLNDCLSVEANIDQTSRAFMQDAVLTMFDQGVVAIVPVDTTLDPKVSGSYDIRSMRVGTIVEWFPKHVKVNLYNENTGKRQDVVVEKKNTVIVENPLYSVMNEPNSTLKRLVSKLNLLDAADAQNMSGKLDLIIQLPYVIKTEARREQAEIRRKDIEMQLSGSKYGIAYTDGTERITQLNRPAENNLTSQINDLKKELYSQLGLTPEVFDGTADEKAMLNYYNRTIEPILGSITEEMTRKFLTKTARSQRQAVIYFRDPFRLVPVGQIAEIADKFTRNEILASNEVRAIIGYKPVSDPAADELRNKNLNPTLVPPNVTGEVPAEQDPYSDYSDYNSETQSY